MKENKKLPDAKNQARKIPKPPSKPIEYKTDNTPSDDKKLKK